MGKDRDCKTGKAFYFRVAREQLGLIAATYSFFPGTVVMKNADSFSHSLYHVDFPKNPAEAMKRDVEVVAKDLKLTLAANLK